MPRRHLGERKEAFPIAATGKYTGGMSTPTTAQPSPNGHSFTAAPVSQSITDRWGSRWVLIGRFARQGCHFEIRTPQGHPVGHLVLTIEGNLGRLVALNIADEAASWLPYFLRRPLARLGLPWPRTGYRQRGLASLLIIHALKAACDLHLNAVIVPGPIPAPARGLFRNLGFVLHDEATGPAATYRISD